MPIVFFWGFFRRFRRLTRRNSELDENFAELDKDLEELGLNFAELEQKSGELAEDFGRVFFSFCWIVQVYFASY